MRRAGLQNFFEKILFGGEDDNEIDYLEEALENFDFNELNLNFELLDISDDDDAEFINDDEWDEEQ